MYICTRACLRSREAIIARIAYCISPPSCRHARMYINSHCLQPTQFSN